ncbi:glycoside hydrolase family 31 protein [Arachidicoccus ginsenosidivorans]
MIKNSLEMRIKYKHQMVFMFLFLVAMGGNLDAQSFIKTNTGIKTSINGLNYELEIFKPDLIRVNKRPADLKLKNSSLSVIRQADPKVYFEVLDQNDLLTLKTDSLKINLDKINGSISFFSNNGQLLLKESPGSIRMKKDEGADRGYYNARQGFELLPSEVLYGLGQQQNGNLDQRHQTNLLVQGNTKVSIPFFQSTKGYGLFWDNYSPTVFKDTLNIVSFTSEVSSGIDYYFMKGNTTDAVVRQMRFLTGNAPMLPLWVYGYNQSKERYKTQFELLDVVKKYRQLKVPLDGIIQDWQYWGDDQHWNAMQFDSTTYPRPRSMVDSVHQLHAHLFVVAWPGFGPKTKQYKEFGQKNMLLNFDTWPPKAGAKIYDVYNPKARDLYWSYLNKGVFSLGVDAWWLDSSEPDHLNEKESDFDEKTFLGTYRSVRNAFPLEHISGIYDHQRKLSDKKRVVILTRSAFAGQQRYGANTWSGDITSNWPTLKRQIPAGLNFSLTGLPYWNTDIGGFFAGEFQKGGGAKNPAFQELYTRWLQFGTFMPMMRSHGTNIPREIYQFGHKGDRIFDILEKYIKLRYHLLPYIYATAWNVTSNGGSFMRPLQSDFKSDPRVAKISDSYLFGSSILVAPVTEKREITKDVYLPKGINWYDFWTGKQLPGGSVDKRAVPLDIMPIYIKAGSILPWGPDVQFATEKKWDDLEIRIYPGADGTFVLYEDQNDNYNYEKGAFSEILMDWDDHAGTLTIGVTKGNYPGMLKTRRFHLVIVDGSAKGTGVERSPKFNKTVIYTGKKIVVKLR